MSPRRLYIVLPLMLSMIAGYEIEGTPLVRQASSQLARACHSQGRGVHLPHVALPKWFRYDGVGNWPQLVDLDADPKEDTFTGQDQEDRFAHDNFFYQQASGTYLEFGAATGKWRGVLIEANPSSFSSLVQNRPGDICIHAAVCANFTQVHFLSSDWTGGIWEFMAPSFQKAWHANVTIASLPKVPCLPLSPLLSKFGVRHINFASIDVEGAELEVLRTLDFNCISIDVIVIEADGHVPQKDQAVRELLFSKGYKVTRVQRNDWFVHESFAASARPGQAWLNFERAS